MKRNFKHTSIRKWRKFRGLTLEQLAGRADMTPSALSMLERGQRGYTQESLEAIAEALATDPASLLVRDPTDEQAIWSIWDKASPSEKRQIFEVVCALKRTASL